MSLVRYRKNNVAFCRDLLGIEPWSFQRRVLESVRDERETLAVTCHSVGKTLLAACVVLWWISMFPGSIAITTSTTLRQVRDLLWKEIRARWKAARVRLSEVEPGVMRWELAPDWFAEGFTAPPYDDTRGQGYHSRVGRVLVVVEEAAGVSSAMYTALSSAMAQEDSRSLYIGNPTWAGGEYGRKARDLPASSVHRVNAFETPNFTAFGITLDDIRSGAWETKTAGRPLPMPYLVSPRWVADAYRDWGENDPRFRSRVLSLFPSDDESALVPLAWAEAAVERWHEIEAEHLECLAHKGPAHTRPRGWFVPHALGVDVARDGADQSVIAARALGIGIRSLTKIRGTETMGLAAEVIDTVRTLRTDEGVKVSSIAVDVVGLGAGTYDRLAEEAHARTSPIHGVALGEAQGGAGANAPTDFANSRCEMLWAVREALRPDAKNPIAIPPDDRLIAQMTSIRWDLDGRGRRVVESKKDFRARLPKMGSPDELDAVAYALAEDLPARETDDGIATLRSIVGVLGRR